MGPGRPGQHPPEQRDRAKPGAWRHRLEPLRELVFIPTDPAVLEVHRTSVLTRTRIAGLIAAVVMPFTLLVYFAAVDPDRLAVALAVALLADLGVLGVLLLMKWGVMQRAYHLPFFVLVGIVVYGVEAVSLQLTGGGTDGSFLFPYFLVLFGAATLFPARLGWALAVTLMCPVSFVLSEWLAHGELSTGARMNLLLLVDAAFIAIIGNRVTTRTFFKEVQHRRGVELANERLREMDKSKSAFFANLSHDLKSPLNVIIGPVQAVARHAEGLDERSRRYLEMALRGARRLDEMINDMLELARIGSGVASYVRETTDIRLLIASLVESTAPYALSIGQRIEFHGPARACFAEVDPDKIERVVANLVSNALKFSNPGATNVVTLEELPGALRICVTDQGPGIPPEERERVFARFARAATADKRVSGTGIGLAVVREFVELHEGKVTVTEAPGGGAQFIVTLPREERPDLHPPGEDDETEMEREHDGAGEPETGPGVTVTGESPSASAAPAPRDVPSTVSRPGGTEGPSAAGTAAPDGHGFRSAAATTGPRAEVTAMTDARRPSRRMRPPGQAPRVMLVEDDDEVRLFLSAELGRSAEVIPLSDGESAVRLASERPDLILLDVNLPGMDGLQTCKSLRKHPLTAETPILVFSARGDLAARLAAFEAGADDFCQKPVEPLELKARIESLLRRAGGSRSERRSYGSGAQLPPEAGSRVAKA